MSRQSFAPGVRRQLRLGAADRTHAPAVTTVHIAGPVVERSCFVGRGYVQRCSRCGRVLNELTDLEIVERGLARKTDDVREVAAARFFGEGRLIAEGPTATYLVRERPLAADEKECEFVPTFAWE